MESKLSLKIVKQMFDSLSFDDRKQFKTLLFDKNRSKTVNIITNYNIIFDIISRCYNLDHFIYKDEKYHEFSNSWGGDQNSNFECSGYQDCSITCLICEKEDEESIEDSDEDYVNIGNRLVLKNNLT